MIGVCKGSSGLPETGVISSTTSSFLIGSLKSLPEGPFLFLRERSSLSETGFNS
jgi:hypothetical protein